MFTGIVEELGEVEALEVRGDSAGLAVRGPLVCSDARLGTSIAVNGVCLTVTDARDGTFSADLMRETLGASALGRLRPGDRVNLERAMPAGGRLAGHLVQGHVDAVADVVSRTAGERWEVVRIALPSTLARYVVHKGSITVDGVSLTVSAVGDWWFEVSLIPTTLQATTLGHRQPGEQVNLEVDIVAKYVERLLAAREGTA